MSVDTQPSSNTNQRDPHVPAVPDNYVKRRFSWTLALSYPIVLFVLLGSLYVGGGLVLRGVNAAWSYVFGSSSKPTATSASIVHTTPLSTNDQQSTPTAMPVPQLNCPYPPTAPDGQPALFFCSPIYQSDISGPYGVRIVLIGENFPASPSQWSINQKPLSRDNLPKQCQPSDKQNCQPIPKPTWQKQLQQNTYLFSWIWQNPFPNVKGDYIISTQVGNQIATTPGANAFTLLTSQAPCITITSTQEQNDQGQSTQCAPLQKLTVHMGGTLTIKGSNWLLGWNNPLSKFNNVQIEIKAICAPKQVCTAPKLFEEIFVKTNKLNQKNGSFIVQQTLTSGLKGTYTVSAWNITDDSQVDGNTAADQSMFFGAETTYLQVQVQ